MKKNRGTGEERNPIPPSEIPALQEMEFDEQERQLLSRCLDAIDAAIGKELTSRFNVELAAAVLQSSCAAAYQDAALSGHPERATESYGELFAAKMAGR